jgi:hypothetical protein
MARTVTVPPVTGVLIRARTLPTTSLAWYFIVAFAGTVAVVKAVHTVPDPGVGVAVIGALPGQHSIVTAPADSEPLPVMRNVVNLGSEKNWVNPTPLVAAF